MEQKIIEKILSVGGMSCSGCELRIEEKLKSMPGILAVTASFSKGTVRVVYNPDKINLEQIINAIRQLDYTVGGNNAENKTNTGNVGNAPAAVKPPISPEKAEDISNIFGILIVLGALYLLIQHTVGFNFLNFIPQINQNMSYGILFVVGLLTSVHCLAMCGGINLSQCVAYQSGDPNPKPGKRMMPSLLYNLGRVTSYTIIGGIVGAIGSVISFSGTAKGVVTIASGVFMVVMGLNMLHIFPWLRKFNIRMPKAIGQKLYSGKTNRGPFLVGMLNGLMPCGPLQAMQLYALGTGSFLTGAFSMLMFSLGTVPLMFAFGAISSLLSGKFTHKMMQVSAVLVMVLGVLMVSRGFSLSGIQIGGAAPGAAQNVAKVSGNEQEITTSFTNGYYAPITVKKGVPVKWTIHVTDSDLNGCNNPVTIPKYNIQKQLVPGDNVIEFTPQDTGTIPYSCWMGMIRSTITVVDSDSDLSAAAAGAAGTAGAAAAAQQQQVPNCCAPQQS